MFGNRTEKNHEMNYFSSIIAKVHFVSELQTFASSYSLIGFGNFREIISHDFHSMSELKMKLAKHSFENITFPFKLELNDSSISERNSEK